MRDIRLLMTADAAGGIWTYALATARALTKRRISTTLAVLGERPSEFVLRGAQAIAGVQIELTDLPLDWTAASASEVTQAGEEIARLARRRNADLIQLNAPALAAAASFHAPTIGVLHSCVATWWEAVHGRAPLPDDLEWRARLTRAGLNRVEVAVAPSHALAKQASRIYALRPPLVIYNGISALQRRPAAARDIPALTAGRLWDEGKNVAALDRAAERLPFRIQAAGPVHGPNGAAIAFDHLDWLGVLESAALRETMTRSAVFVSLALYEPFGLAVLEAAQAGCALVLSDIPTFRELWEGAALFVTPSDSRAIADALNKLTTDTQLRTRLTEAASRRAAQYTVEKAAGELAALMRSLLVQPQRRAS